MVNTERIESAVAVNILRKKKVTIVGSATRFAQNLARCGVEKFDLNDFDSVNASNVARQDYTTEDVGELKIEATARKIRNINPRAQVTCIAEDCTTKSDDEINAIFRNVDLIVLATDSHRAQAWGNTVALRLGINALWMGLYPGGKAGEIIFWHPGIASCHRCLVPTRYEAHAAAAKRGESLDPPSDGATIFDIDLLDAIGGGIAIGLLTPGADNRCGKIVAQLGDRNFIQIKIDHEWRIGGRDVVREQLGIADNCDTYFSWNTIARRDPDGGNLPCEDCEKYRGVTFNSVPGGTLRNNPSEPSPHVTQTTAGPHGEPSESNPTPVEDVF